MKKAISISLCLIFLVSVMGMTLNAHYCGSNLKSVSLVKQGCCCGDEQENDCCKNEVTYIKIKDDFSVSTQIKFHKQVVYLTIIDQTSIDPPKTDSNTFDTPYYSIKHSQDRKILFCSLLI